MSLLRRIRNALAGKPAVVPPPPQAAEVDDGPLIPNRDAPVKSLGGDERRNLRAVSLDSAATYDAKIAARAADSADTIHGQGSDASGSTAVKGDVGFYGVPELLQDWYLSNGFIGWQMSAIIAQHWLVEKACAMPGQDAIRNGYEINVADGAELDSKTMDQIRRLDSKYKVLENCGELVKFTNVFGIRVVMFKVESDDATYYEKPFNIDGVTRGSYRGMAQIDPYWMAPLLDNEASADPSSPHFYEPTWWVINGQKIHRTHLHITRDAPVADILKPSYYYGGVSLVQRIYERVYAAERTANEAPLLAMSKRTNIMKLDTKKAAANFAAVTKRLMDWVWFRDNHGIRVIDKDEEMEMQDTSLADLDAVIMTQYQLVAAIAEIPATKLLGTSPKGFGASGEYEELSYHEKLESLQSDWLNGLVEHHYLLMCKSLGLAVNIEVVWNPVGTKSPEQLAELNAKKVEAGERLILNGVISPDEERTRVRNDKHSGYSSLGDDDASPVIERESSAAQSIPGNEEYDDHVDSDSTGAYIEGEPAEPQKYVAGQVVAPGNESEFLARSDEAVKEDGPSVVSQFAVNRTVKPSVVGINKANQTPAQSPESSKDVILSLLGELVSILEPSSLPALDGKGMDEDRGTFRRKWRGLQLYVETKAGESRTGKDYHTPKMPADYGYIKGYEDADGDSVDCFLGPDMDSKKVYVVNQIVPETGKFDEHKVLIGFNSFEAANACYDAAHDDDWSGKGDVFELSTGELKDWLDNGNLKLPLEA